ncbi:hypothetical protein B0H10DRAFT_1962146 [Mycena sp. CBHHK59/15]|nr:hypothetical protein B0H10DRAFT_1962146 [Mycena sp. CBHHK59/15]
MRFRASKEDGNAMNALVHPTVFYSFPGFGFFGYSGVCSHPSFEPEFRFGSGSVRVRNLTAATLVWNQNSAGVKCARTEKEICIVLDSSTALTRDGDATMTRDGFCRDKVGGKWMEEKRRQAVHSMMDNGLGDPEAAKRRASRHFSSAEWPKSGHFV